MPLTGPSFVRTKSNNFIEGLVSELHTNGKTGISAWIVVNAESMNGRTFLDAEPDLLRNLDPDILLVVRAFTPAGVFTAAAKKAYLRAVDGVPLADATADVLFAKEDATVIERSPSNGRDALVFMMKQAYKKGIRPPDSAVTAM